MKATSLQIYNAAIQLLSGVLADSNVKFPLEDSYIKRCIDIAFRTAELIPECNILPSDDEIKTACYKSIEKNKPIAASLLGNMFASHFDVQITVAYSIIQKAVQLGYITASHEGKRTLYTLA